MLSSTCCLYFCLSVFLNLNFSVSRFLFQSNIALVYFTDSGREEDLISKNRWWGDWLEQSPAIYQASMAHGWKPLLHTKVFTKHFYYTLSTMLSAPYRLNREDQLVPKLASMFPSAVSLPITVGFHRVLDTLSATRSSNQAATLSTVSAAYCLSTEFHAEGFVKWIL